MVMDTSWIKHIDWTKEKTYEDLAELFGAFSQAFDGADVTSRTGDFVDGSTKQHVLSRINEVAALMNNHKDWLYVRPEKNYTHYEGHKK